MLQLAKMCGLGLKGSRVIVLYKLQLEFPKTILFCHHSNAAPAGRGAHSGQTLLHQSLVQQRLPRRAYLVLGEVDNWCPLCTFAHCFSGTTTPNQKDI